MAGQYLDGFNLNDFSTHHSCQIEEETFENIFLICITPNLVRESLRAIVGVNEGLIKTDKNYWALAAAVYYRHRAVEVT